MHTVSNLYISHAYTYVMHVFITVLKQYVPRPYKFVTREKNMRRLEGSMKRVLMLGAGYVSGPCVEYLTDDGVAVTVGAPCLTSHFLSLDLSTFISVYYHHSSSFWLVNKKCGALELNKNYEVLKINFIS